MAREVLPLNEIITMVRNEISSAARALEDSGDDVGFVVGECTIALPLFLEIDGKATVGRFPALQDGEEVPMEALSRVSLSLRRNLRLVEGTTPDRLR
jgi:hypothetical protein